MGTGKNSRPRAHATHQPALQAPQARPGPPAASDGAPPFRDPGAIIAAIEHEIIPRLVRAGGILPMVSQLPGFEPARVTRSDQEVFLGHILSSRAQEASAMALRLLARGAGAEAIFSSLLTWTARRLGALWEADECSFTDVTIGVCHLQGILHHVSETIEQPALAGRQRTPSAFISPAPGEQHAFGALMVADCFRQDGWIVHCEAALSLEELLAAVSEQGFDVIGLSFARDLDPAGLASQIAAVRAS